MDTLYNETSDGVVNLNYATFHSTVFSHQNTNGFLVKFYATWCGHCKAFAPKYKKLARDVIAWSPVIKLSAVNCADPLNLRLCRDQRVMAYPTLKFFPPHNLKHHVVSKDKNSLNDSVEFILEETTTVSMRNSLVNTILDFIVSSLKGDEYPPLWPQLFPVNASNSKEFIERTNLRNKTSNNKPVLLIVEQEEDSNEARESILTSSVGAEVILDLSSYQDFITVYRMFYKATNFNTIFSSLRLNSRDESLQSKLPVLFRVKPSLPMMIHPIDVQLLLTSSEDSGPSMSRQAIVDYVADHFLKGVYSDQSERLIAVPTDSSEEEDEDTSSETGHPPRGFTTKVHMIDLYNAIRYSFFHEVLLHQSFNQSQVKALQKYFLVLNKFFPFDNENPRRFIRRMTQWIHGRNETSSSALHAIMRAGSEGFLFPLRPYVSCKGSRPELRGYPCALWLLFHTLTISEYNHLKTQLSKDSNYNITHLVLPAMKDYVKHFFTCKQCSDHFAVMAYRMEEELLHDNSSVLWLWKNHNEVNARLAGKTESEDPFFPKGLYPSMEMCPECYAVNNLTAVTLETGASSTSSHSIEPLETSSLEFDETQVINFLVSQYQRSSLIRKVTSAGESVASPGMLFSGMLMMTTSYLLINFPSSSNTL